MAAASIAEHLSTPPSLSRITVLKQRIVKERSSLQASLTEQAREQVDSVKHGLQQLKESRQTVEQIKESVRQIEKACSDPRSKIQGFDKLLQVSAVHRRFQRVLETVQGLKEMVDRLTVIESLLAQDRADPYGPSPNLLTVHYHLTELETFRNETMAQSKRSNTSKQALETLETYFDKLGSVLESFEAHYFRLCRDLIEIVKSGHPELAVRIAKIAEVEGKRDERAIAIKMVKRTANQDIASRFKSIQAEARTIKHYRSKVVEEIREGCVLSVANSFKRAGENAIRWMEELEWLFDDLELVEKELGPRFPPDWRIRTVYIKGYHKALYDFLNGYVASSPDPSALIRLSQFTKEYRSTMMKSFKVPQEYLEPPLLDGKESDLLENYYKLIVDKMAEWTDNLMKTDIADFTARTDPPELDAEGHYCLQGGAVILFQMLNQQIDLALDSNQGAILLRVVQEAAKTMTRVQTQWLQTIDQEFKRQTTPSSADTEVPGGLAEYVMALANDQVKCADFAEALGARLEPLVSSKYSQPIVESLNQSVDGFLDVAKRCVAVLIDLVFHDLKPATKTLWQSQWYVDDQPMMQIVETMRDYMVEDYKVRLNSSLFELLVEDIIDTFLVTYLVAMRKAKTIKVPAAVERMKRDADMAFEFFKQFKPARELAAYFDVLEAVRKLISASKMMVFLDYWPFRKQYGPNIQFVEAIMKARDDLDRSATNEIMESIKRKVSADTTTKDDPEQPSIFQRLPAK